MNIVRRTRLPGLVVALAITAGCGATAVRPDTDSGVTPTPDAAVPTDAGARGDVAPVDVPVAPVDVLVAPVDVPVAPVDVPVAPVDVPVVRVDAGPLTECDPANNGLRCGPPGSGCGGGGGGSCSPASMCSCGGDQRWSCTVTFPPGCDGGVAPVDAGPAPVCALAGSWRAAFGSESLYFVFTEDGRWIGRAAPDGPTVVEGTYLVAGEQVTLTGEMGMSGGGCLATDRGLYRLEFRANCAELSLGRISEDCAPRGDTLAMLRFSRS